MLKFIKIRNSYGRRRIGELSINEQALLEYEKFCLELMNQAEKQQEVIDRIDKYIKENIYSYYDSKGEKCIEETVFERNANPKELLDILKRCQNENRRLF